LIQFAGSIEGADTATLDVTIVHYVQSTVTVLLNIAVIEALLGFFGVDVRGGRSGDWRRLERAAGQLCGPA
jgi:hypothetical protein